jgi:hypothetical protein
MFLSNPYSIKKQFVLSLIQRAFVKCVAHIIGGEGRNARPPEVRAKCLDANYDQSGSSKLIVQREDHMADFHVQVQWSRVNLHPIEMKKSSWTCHRLNDFATKPEGAAFVSRFAFRFSYGRATRLPRFVRLLCSLST